MKMELYLLIKSNVRIKIGNFNKYVLDKFRRDFENTESGVRRNWKNIEDDRIQELFKDARDKTDDVFKSAKLAYFPAMLSGEYNI